MATNLTHNQQALDNPSSTQKGEFLTNKARAKTTSNRVRRETLNGRNYLVVPTRLLKVGVLNGSDGALFYPQEEISGIEDSWNGMPLVLNHPVRNGVNVSAREPAVLKQQGIGYVYNATTRKGPLDAEAWIDIEKANDLDPSIIMNIESGRPVEVSTGLYTSKEVAPAGANYKGKSYDFIARDYVPDHLAILPTTVGACSVEDGCGILMVNKSQDLTSNSDDVSTFFLTLLHAATSAHLLHLQTRSFAQHLALDELYKELPGLTDDLIEAYQGKNELVLNYPSGYTPPTLPPVEFIVSLITYVRENRASVGQDSELQNIVDEICGLLDSVAYKLRFLS